MVLGVVAALPSYAVIMLRPRWRVDETLDVLAAHGVAGLTGILFIGLVAQESWNGVADGAFYGRFAQLGEQFVAVLAAPGLRVRRHVRAAEADRARRAAAGDGARGGASAWTSSPTARRPTRRARARSSSTPGAEAAEGARARGGVGSRPMGPAKTPEHVRLEQARTGDVPWKAWGPYLSERQWGTVREDYSRQRRRVEPLHARPGPLARLPLGRGRDRRDLRRAAAAVSGARALERERPDPQGADVRAHQQRGQPRRGRQGVLVLPRQHAHALVPEVPVQVPAARVPVRGPRPRERPPRQAGLRVRAARHRDLRRRPLLRRRRRVREGRA